MEKKEIQIAFVILHYNNMDDTLVCIQSIGQLNNSSEYEIVIVDNASPNGSGKDLKEKYEGQEHIHVILSEKNLGFSEGNNLGFQFVKEHFKAQFVVVCNNDVEFPDLDFGKKIEEIYHKTPFHVLGPDIYNPHQNYHQSPQGKTSPTYIRAVSTWAMNRLAYTFYPIYWPLFGKKQIQHLASMTNADPDWDKPQDQVPVQGACIIFSSDFVEAEDKAFMPDTFLYYEEYLLYNRCNKKGYAMIYRPQIQIVHHEGRARATLQTDEKKRHRRLLYNYSHAAGIYMRSLKK